MIISIFDGNKTIMKSSNLKRLFILIWIVLSLSTLASAGTLIKGAFQLTSAPLLFWLTFLKLLTSVVLLLMGVSLWKIVKVYNGNCEWRDDYYRKVRQVGYWAIVLTFLNAIFYAGYEQVLYQLSHPATYSPALYIFRRFYAILLMESPAMWVLTLCIFLFAELLHSAHQLKKENESFI